MKRTSDFVAVLFFFWLFNALVAQRMYHVHSHNDYLQDLPFWYAYSNGAASIEVDLFLKNDTLFCTHSEREIDHISTLQNLYLDPLNNLAQSGKLNELQLLIDLKSEAHQSLEKVMNVIEQYPLLVNSTQLKFIISGNRPKPSDYINYPDYIFFDHQNLEDLHGLDLRKIAMISRSYKDYSVWNGYGRMTANDLSKVGAAIQKAKDVNIPFRFWATPDTKTSWATMAQLGVHYVNTDYPAEAKIFLDKLDSYSYKLTNQQGTYNPRYEYDNNSIPSNIILMIGDGNGLAQISATMVANKGELSLTKIKNIGLVNTSSADDLVTDSAAAGTAISTGVKTNNRAIGVDPLGQFTETLIEILSSKGYNTAIITTDAIYGATPSTFYAHTDERDNTDKIIEDLKKSELDLFIAGGSSKKTMISESFKTKTLDELDDIQERTAIYFGEENMPSMQEGREDVMPRSIKKAMEVLQGSGKPFFLLVEGAQIDNGGHSNDITKIITEMLDFDQTVEEALKYADKLGNTLVVITADHETGGLGIAGGSSGEVRADFLSVDHTGIMVPLFAYGPQSLAFTGYMDNTDIFRRILEVIGIE
jgi:alkaline phosphatase